jgi:putative transposase
MNNRQFKLSEQEQQALQQREMVTRNVRELKRLQAVRLYGSGQAMATVVEVVGSSKRSIQRWVQDYQQQGIDGLKPGWRGDNAKKLSDAQRAEVVQRLQQYQPAQLLGPDQRLSQGAFWTVRDVQVALNAWYGVDYRSDDSYRALLYEAEFSYHRAEGVYRSQPSQVEVALFEEALEKSHRLPTSTPQRLDSEYGPVEPVFPSQPDPRMVS